MQQNFGNRPPVNPKPPRCFALAQLLMMARQTNSPIQFHSVHPQASSQCKLASETKKAGVLLRRYSENIPAVPVDHFCTGALKLRQQMRSGLLCHPPPIPLPGGQIARPLYEAVNDVLKRERTGEFLDIPNLMVLGDIAERMLGCPFLYNLAASIAPDRCQPSIYGIRFVRHQADKLRVVWHYLHQKVGYRRPL